MHFLRHLFVFFSMALVGSSVKCYRCRGEKGRNISDYDIQCFESGGQNISECPLGCVKAISHSPAEVVIRRSCSDHKVEKDECVIHPPDVPDFTFEIEECRCKGDLCNNALGIPSALITTAALLALLAIVY